MTSTIFRISLVDNGMLFPQSFSFSPKCSLCICAKSEGFNTKSTLSLNSKDDSSSKNRRPSVVSTPIEMGFPLTIPLTASLKSRSTLSFI